MIFLDKKIIFLLPPKCGTTSLLTLLSNLPNISSNVSLRNTRHTLLSRVVKSNNLQDTIQDYKIYQLCRNPLDRLVSSFYFYSNQFGVQRFLNQTQTYKNGEFKLTKELNFTNTMEVFLPHLHLLANSPNHKDYPAYSGKKFFHGFFMFFSPQSMWNDLDMDVEYIKLEDLKKNTSILSSIFKKDFQHEFPSANVNKKRPSQPYLEMFTKKTLELAYKAYEQDFKILKYK